MKNDLRYERTESLIFDSFFKLISKKSFDSVSVTDICKSARISRNAFYAHYIDKFDLINKITNRKNLARVSSMPGKTITVNFFKGDGVVFADLPGYGYAKREQSEKKRWAELMEGYFHSGRNIALVIQLIDMRHAPSADDMTMLNFLRESGIPFVSVEDIDNLSATKKFISPEAYAKYNDSWGVHNLDVLAGYSWQNNYWANRDVTYYNITDDIKSESLISERLAENIKLAFGACMPEKIQSLSEKTIHIRSNSAAPDKQLPVKYLSEIISARVEEIMMAILYEIDKSGFADMLRSGIVVTGGSARIANLGNFIYDLSGYKVRTGYPKALFSCQGCEGISDTSATASLGLILAAKDDQTVNCIISGEPAGAGIKTEEVEPEIDEPKEEKLEQGSFWSDDQIETVAPKPKPKRQKDNGLKVTWTKIGQFFEGLYDNVSEDIDNEKA